MINLPASQLRLQKLTKAEKENVKAMSIFKRYKEELENAHEMKRCYLKCKEVIKSGINVEENEKALEYFRLEAIDSWNKSQDLLSDYEQIKNER